MAIERLMVYGYDRKQKSSFTLAHTILNLEREHLKDILLSPHDSSRARKTLDRMVKDATREIRGKFPSEKGRNPKTWQVLEAIGEYLSRTFDHTAKAQITLTECLNSAENGRGVLDCDASAFLYVAIRQSFHKMERFKYSELPNSVTLAKTPGHILLMYGGAETGRYVSQSALKKDDTGKFVFRVYPLEEYILADQDHSRSISEGIYLSPMTLGEIIGQHKSQIGYNLLFKGRPDLAQPLFLDALDLNPRCITTYNGLFQVYVDTNDFEGARQIALKSLARFPYVPDFYRNLFDVLTKVGSLDDHAGILDSLFSLGYSCKEEVRDLSGWMIDEGNIAGSISLLERGIAHFPAYASLHNNLAISYEKTGAANKALEHFVKSLVLDPADPGKWKALAHSLRDNGRPFNYLSTISRFRQLSPPSPPALAISPPSA